MIETAGVALNKQQLRELLKTDAEFFIQFFLGDQLQFPVPDIHKDVFSKMTWTDILRLLVILPRGHAKTMLCKLAAVWYLMFSDFRFVLYVSGAHDLVVPYVNDIVSFFECDNFVSLFGIAQFEIRQDGKGIYKFYIPSIKKMCILRGLGAGQRVRGINVDNARPELIICDDLEDSNETEGKGEHDKLIRWWFGPFIKCVNPVRNKIIMAGNLTAKLSLLYKFLKSDYWHSFLYSCLLKSGEPLWPDVWPIEKLRADYLEYKSNKMTHIWFAEMMNQPIPEGGGLIDVEKICYRPRQLPESVQWVFATCDPAFSAETWADNLAIGVHGWVIENNQWQTLETFHQQGIDAASAFFKAVEMVSSWGGHIIGVENTGAQRILVDYWRQLKVIHELSHVEIKPINTGMKAKTLRLATWASMLQINPVTDEQAMWAINDDDFFITQQLLNYDPKKKDNDDDIIDMCAMGQIMIDTYLSDLMFSNPQIRHSQVQTLYQIAEV